MASGSRDAAHAPRSQSSGGSNVRGANVAASAAAAEYTVSKAIAQYTVDARLHAVFEQSGERGSSFDYSQSVLRTPQPASSNSAAAAERQITAYLSRIQRGGHIQPFGCTLAVDDSSFRVLAFSENAPELLDLLPPHSLVPSLPPDDADADARGGLRLGCDARSLFAPASAALLERAAAAREISLLNPLWVHSRAASAKPFYAILHRVDVGIVVDLEPAPRSDDPALSVAGAVQSQKLAVRAISRLQALPGGDVRLLCDTVVQHVRELTGYDRVMVYRFHEDEHGEVVAESRRADLEPYLGLHYPATDIPQASRFLFRQNRVRMIADCHAPPCACCRTPPSPSRSASPGTADVDDKASSSSSAMKLWGLVVCHHTSPRCIPFPLRYACERCSATCSSATPHGDRHAEPQHHGPRQVRRRRPLLPRPLLPARRHPTEPQIRDLIGWLAASHGDSTGLSTDSLADAGYPNAAALGDAVCGMAVAYITPDDYLFWFRSHTAKEIKWGGAKHHPNDKDDGQRMHPRSSFKAFLEVVKSRSLPWENAEMDAIHSLQLILRDSFRDAAAAAAEGTTTVAGSSGGGSSKAVVNGQLGDLELQGIEELSSVAREMVRLIETATAPIFAVDSDGRINGWNTKVAELTGLSVEEAMGKSLVHDLVFKESVEVTDKLLYRALRGEEDKNVEIKLKTFGSQQSKNAIFVVVNACSSRDYTNNIVGVCFVGQDVTGQKVVMDKFVHIQGDYKAIVHSPNL
uniref:Phytochrome B n=1 Tax=Ananas comosus var. bracteatus TaxID=296719 RepID=A0A6V7PQR0_ANACO|nr:unnamed protein product [Ananas comosus var. bracteatus]